MKKLLAMFLLAASSAAFAGSNGWGGLWGAPTVAPNPMFTPYSFSPYSPFSPIYGGNVNGSDSLDWITKPTLHRQRQLEKEKQQQATNPTQPTKECGL